MNEFRYILLKKRQFSLIFTVFTLIFFIKPIFAATIAGFWRTAKISQHIPSSVIQLRQNGKFYEGRVLAEFNADGHRHDGRCSSCRGKYQGKTLHHVKLVWGLQPYAGHQRAHRGFVLDPTSDRTYRFRVELQQGGKQLKVRGYFGIPLLGRTMTWYRVAKPG